MKGLVILIGLIAFVAIGCVAIPFIVMPNAGIAAALPVIYVPGEHLAVLGHIPITNVPITNTIFSTWLVIAFVFLWVLPIVARRKDIPGRAQAFVELLVEAWYGLAKGVAGAKARQLMPLILSIFFLLLPANLIKIFPGVDSVGELHCAGLIPPHVDQDDSTASRENYVQFNGYDVNRLGNVLGLEIYALKNTETVNVGETLAYEQYKDCKETLHRISAEDDFNLENRAEGYEEAPAEPHDENGENGEGEESEDAEGESRIMLTSAQSQPPSASEPQAEAGRHYNTHPSEDRYVVTPFIRGPSTDLSLTLAMAIVAMVMAQFFGIKELGFGGWGVKFVNILALEKGGIKFIDFVVGLLEAVLEFAKVVSFAFRLFGAMFAGQVLMFVIVFLVATFVPVIVVVLEVFIGLIQAFVFAILFLMFASVAMTPLHDDHSHEHH